MQGQFKNLPMQISRSSRKCARTGAGVLPQEIRGPELRVMIADGADDPSKGPINAGRMRTGIWMESRRQTNNEKR